MRGSWRLNKDCNILTPTLMAISVVSFSFSRATQLEARGLSFLLRAGFLYHILSPTGLLTHLSPTHWLPVLTELCNSSIAHSISILMASQAGICHFRRLWISMLDHHQAEITVMQFRGLSLPVNQSMRVSWDFTLSHFVSQARLRDFFT